MKLYRMLFLSTELLVLYVSLLSCTQATVCVRTLQHCGGGRRDRENDREALNTDATRLFLPRSTSSRDKDIQHCLSARQQPKQGERSQGGKKQRKRAKQKLGAPSNCEPDSDTRPSHPREEKTDSCPVEKRWPLAFHHGRKTIEADYRKQVYYQECDMFGLVAKMLIVKDQSLGRPVQSSLQENLRDIGERCVEAIGEFIEDCDSRELSN